MKKITCILTALVLLLIGTCAYAEENLIANGDFSSISDGLPVGWTTEVWYTDVSIFSMDADGYSGNCVFLSSTSANDARFAQTVAVEPDTLYRISCKCRVSDVGADGIGATISIKNLFVYSEQLTDTGGEWADLELYGRTGADQTSLTVYARIGGYGDANLNTGNAWFDDFVMEAVESAPIDATVHSFAIATSNNNNNASNNASSFNVSSTTEPARNTETFLLLTVVYALVVLAIVRKFRHNPEQEVVHYDKLFIVTLIAALFVRVVLSVCVFGYHTDINCFASWSIRMYNLGPAQFYSDSIFCDYPPLYMLMLSPIAALCDLLNLQTFSPAHLFLLKLWPILFDLAGVYLVYTRTRKRLGGRAALLLSAFFAFNPAVVLDSSGWGQIDSVLTLMIALCALEAEDERYVHSLIYFALAALIKPQALLFAPLGLFAIIVQRIRHARNPLRALRLTIVGMLLAAFATLSAIVLKNGLTASLHDALFYLQIAVFFLVLLVLMLFFWIHMRWEEERRVLYRRLLIGTGVGLLTLAVLLFVLYLMPLGSNAILNILLKIIFVACGAGLVILLILWILSSVFAEPQYALPTRRLILGITAACGILYLFALIFCWDFSDGFLSGLIKPVSWLVGLYSGTMTGYSHLTVNTLNLYYLFDLNWADTVNHPGFTMLSWALFALAYITCASIYAASKRQYSVLGSHDDGPSASLHANASLRKRGLLPLVGGLLIVLICMFGPMIHERYIYPAILLLTLGYAAVRDVRLLTSLVVLTCTLFLNEFLVLQGGMTAANYGHLQDSEHWLNTIVAVINVLNAGYLTWITFDICVRGNLYPPAVLNFESKQSRTNDLFSKSNYKLNLKRLDVLLIASVTAIYAIVAFVNLGSTKAPQTTWVSTASNEAIVLDLGEVEDFRLTYYGNICNTNFTVELSNDGEVWTEPHYALYNQGEIFRWIWFVPMDSSGNVLYHTTTPTLDDTAYWTYANYVDESHPLQTARYVRLSARSSGLKLNEVVFLDAEGNILPVEFVSHTGYLEGWESDPLLLLDEQDTAVEYPSYYNSTYFDEIYHARTAYEHLNGLKTYEYTHPPLGKVLMMMGIELFGMTPFGWRFMGTLVGVLMVPLMYLLVKQLTKSTSLSFIAMFLLSVDSMHFTQTRIATIDSYAVFWIMLMYLFMFRFCQMSWHTRKEFWRSLIPLMLCGITMGIAWATKWIGIYASAGLAVLFFWTLFRHWRTYRYAVKHSNQSTLSGVSLDDVRDSFWPRCILVIGLCVIFFIVIPLLIYYFSYYWHLRGEGLQSFWEMFKGENIQKIVKLQEDILNYHAGLGDDPHYFRSPWYQWPIIWWPMWYYSGTAYMPDGVISSISCMGNPAVWWFGLIAMIFAIVRMCYTRRAPRTYVMVVVGFASQFLPWVLVPRSTFIYHYFASVPFIIMATALFLQWIRSWSEHFYRSVVQSTRPRKMVAATDQSEGPRNDAQPSPESFDSIFNYAKFSMKLDFVRHLYPIIALTLMILALVLFIAFYPLESGTPVARSYANLLRWFKWYNF